ncbi:MAG: chemotaxis protein CheW [Gammaproteobacteria bacterium]|jgi:chemotaxis-related protein WspD
MRDCWNQIGVWSKQPAKCEKLREVIHCRNCDVYTKAGRTVIEKAASADYVAQWTKSYSQAIPATVKKQCSVVMFRVAAEWFCLPTLYCESVENRGSIHSIPRYSNQLLLGIANIRGTLRVCFSLHTLLQVAPDNNSMLKKVGVYGRLLVINYNHQYYVFPVDEVGGIERIDDTNLDSSPATLSERQAEFVRGMIKTENHTIAFLNAVPLFTALEEAIGD